MFNDFLMFVAPGLTIIAAIALAFVFAKYDDVVREDEK